MSDPVFSKPITLEEPIKRGDNEVSEVKVRRPSSGELRGLSLVEAGQLQVDALIKLLPRITQPRLETHEIETLVPSDLLALGAEVGNFLLPKAIRVASQTE